MPAIRGVLDGIFQQIVKDAPQLILIAIYRWQPWFNIDIDADMGAFCSVLECVICFAHDGAQIQVGAFSGVHHGFHAR